uniref:Sugar phosphate transporter domain-containing protein n=1 Tax=Spongospora subterranea TaxID=70186 RepID=A0A0H5R8Q2_9EUKA|eukprot:CRZ10097.1 hypothetical protein [Spongospora subterranea]
MTDSTPNPGAFEPCTAIEFSAKTLTDDSQANEAHIRRRLLKIVSIFVLSLSIIASASSHTLCAQPFKKDLGIKGLELPWLHSIITSGSFPFGFVIWLIIARGKIEVPSWARWRSYAVLAFFNAADILFGSFALNILPAAQYAILRGSSLIFVVILSKVMTRKQFNIWQYTAVGLMSVAVVLMTITDTTDPEKRRELLDLSGNKVWGIFAAITGSVFVSLLSVATQKLFAADQSKGDLQFVCQINCCQSFLATVMLLPIAFFTEEFHSLSTNLATISAAGFMPKMLWLLAGMSISAPIMLFANIGLTSVTSATFARSLGGPRRIVIIVMSWLLFNQEINVLTAIAALFMTLSLGIYIYGGHRLQQSKQSSK